MAFTLSDVPSQKLPLYHDFLPNSTTAVLQPHLRGLGSSQFARRYLGNLYWFLFPSYLDGSLHSVWLLCPIYSGIQVVINYRITPFGNPGVNGYVLLSPAYRSLSRPSSSYSSQASAINLYSLDHITIFAFYFESSFKTPILFRPYHPFYSSLVRSDSSRSFVSSLGKLIAGNRISFPFLPSSFQKTLPDLPFRYFRYSLKCF